MANKKREKSLTQTANDLLIDMHVLAKQFEVYSINDDYKKLFTEMFPEDQKATQPSNIDEVFARMEILAHSKDPTTREFIEKITEQLEKRKFSEYLNELMKKKGQFYKSRTAYLSTKLIHLLTLHF